jgi:hypothetical protein
MRYDFSNVTMEDLARLFPVILTEHNPKWNDYYQEEEAFLRSIFCDKIIRINHRVVRLYLESVQSLPLISCWRFQKILIYKQ